MLRSLILAFLLTAPSFAGIWPEKLGPYSRKSVAPVDIRSDDRAQWDEYGIDAAEAADYGVFKVEASRYKDATGAYAASLESPRIHLQAGNYLVTCSGSCPKNLAALVQALPNETHGPLPALANYLPPKNVVKDSERYILGPKGLAKNAPQVPEAAAAFQFGTEAATAQYRTSEGPRNVAIFSFPSPQIARQQFPAFAAIPGAFAKRDGPLVAVVLPANPGQAPDQAVAEKLLAQINYRASLAIDEPPPLVLKPETTAQMLLSIFELAGIVLAFCVLSGLLFGGLRVLAKKFGYSDAGESLTWLRLGGK